ncbi:unnamed protein product [Musa hybrid cultivar]
MDVPSYITIGGWFIQVIFDKFLSSKLQTWAVNSGIGNDLDKLRVAMLRIRSVLSSAEKTQSDGLVGWMKELRDVAYDAEDLLDELEYRRLQQQLDGESSSPVSAFLVSNLEAARDVATLAGGLLSSSFFSFKCGGSASNQEAAAASSAPRPCSNSRPPGTPELAWDRITKARIRSVIERLDHVSCCVSETITLFKLDRCSSGPKQSTRKGATSSLISTKVFGREDEVRNLIDLLLLMRSNDEPVSVLPVVGIGGVGKTTLAQLVYNDPKIVRHFELRMWVCVSDSFDDTELTREILECASSGDYLQHPSVTNFNRLQTAIKDQVAWKRFLLVLDDVWNDERNNRLSEMERWDKLLAPLKAGKSGSKILVTTRSGTVSETLGTMHSIDLKGLRDQDCWSLIKEHTFRDANHEEQLKLERIGSEVAQQLKGLPLAAKAIARLRKNKMDAEEWNSVLVRNDIWDHIIPILKPSYYNLPAHLQRCFAYCSIFPKGWKFESDDLIHLWMAQGYIQPRNKNVRMEDAGQDYMNDLMRRSFFQVQNKEFVTLYGIHDPLHDLAQSVSGDECIIVEDDEPTNIPPSVRHLSIKAEKLVMVKDVYHHHLHNLRTLISFSGVLRSGLHDGLLVDVLRDLKHIRVLDLSHCKMDNLPEVICQCIHLRFLNLSSTSIQCLPESLCRLYHLQVLNLNGCRLRSLPRDMKNLVSLRHLTAADQLISDIAEIGRLTCLQRLQVFKVRTEAGYTIRELRDLNELRGSLYVRNLENVESENKASEAMLNGKEHLSVLQFQWQSGERNQVVDDDDEVLEGLRPHPNLKRLEIMGCRGATYPSWLKTQWLTDLNIIYLSGCRRWESLPPLAQLPSLKVLWIQGLHATKSIGWELLGPGREVFRRLEELVLDGMPELEEFLGDGRFFPHLQSVVIKDCNKLKILPPLPCNLTELTVLDHGFWIPYFDDTRTAPVGSIVSSLCIYNCPVLIAGFCVSLKEEDSLSSLQTLSVGDISLLTGLTVSKNLACLQNLEIHNCLEITSLTTEQEKAFEDLTFLRTLCFNGCANLRSLPNLRGLRYLKKLIVSNCPQMQSLPKKGLPSSLKVLEIASCHPLLKGRCGKEGGSNWESIRHIPRIEIDGEVIQEEASGN